MPQAAVGTEFRIAAGGGARLLPSVTGTKMTAGSRRVASGEKIKSITSLIVLLALLAVSR